MALNGHPEGRRRCIVWSAADRSYLSAAGTYGLTAEDVADDLGRSVEAVVALALRDGVGLRREFSHPECR